MKSQSESEADRVVFLVNRQADGRVCARQRDGELVVHAESLSELRRLLPASVRQQYGLELRTTLLVGTPAPVERDIAGMGDGVQPGAAFVMTVPPPASYAGRVGARAVVVTAAEHVYVQFDSGVLESFPRGRFVEYFQPARRGRADDQPS